MSDEEIKDILKLKRVAVVGISRDPNKAAHQVPKYLLEHGYDIIPVNPSADQILGRKCYKSLEEVEGEIDIVDIFRPSDQVMPVVKEAIKKKPKVIWMQLGIRNDEAAKEAEKHGIKVVQDRCMMEEHMRLYK
ncbi:MAG: CoA-binding protein [Candidatus Nitrosocaldaceae archaeon]|nr:MAG: CoA-binding protein [Candidatus Nitrosothermus koennekii]GIU71865.1 MAG: CoA-binding protein [Candidatus Nitrosocaldaceae archaeon]